MLICSSLMIFCLMQLKPMFDKLNVMMEMDGVLAFKGSPTFKGLSPEERRGLSLTTSSPKVDQELGSRQETEAEAVISTVVVPAESDKKNAIKESGLKVVNDESEPSRALSPPPLLPPSAGSPTQLGASLTSVSSPPPPPPPPQQASTEATERGSMGIVMPRAAGPRTPDAPMDVKPLPERESARLPSIRPATMPSLRPEALPELKPNKDVAAHQLPHVTRRWPKWLKETEANGSRTADI